MTAEMAAELLERFEADRETVAWEIVHRFTPYLKKTASKYWHDREDMLVESQLYFYDRLLKWDASRGTPFGAFVYTTAKFAVRSAANKMKRQWDKNSRNNPYPTLDEEGTEELLGRLDENVERHADVRWTVDLLDTLPARTREMVAMRFGLEGYEPMHIYEIAEHFGVSRNRAGKIIELALIELDWSVRRGEV